MRCIPSPRTSLLVPPPSVLNTMPRCPESTVGQRQPGRNGATASEARSRVRRVRRIVTSRDAPTYHGGDGRRHLLVARRRDGGRPAVALGKRRGRARAAGEIDTPEIGAVTSEGRLAPGGSMSSRLALALAVALVALRAAPARAEPFDVDLSRLGPPDAAVWRDYISGGTLTQAQADGLAADAKKRFGILSSQMALAMSGPILDPASTTGHAGFDFAFEGAYQPVEDTTVGAPLYGFGAQAWPTRSGSPGSLTTTGVHVRKALPFSFEFGGRLTYVNKTSYFAAQGEAKWALNEGFEKVPDLAVRVAYTRLFGQADWNLGVFDVDLMVSKRWGVSAVTSFTPYLALRYAFVNASSDMIDFQSYAAGTPSGPPLAQSAGVAGFPTLRLGLFRTTLGVRMTASTVSMAFEGTYFAGTSYAGKDAPSRDEYPDFKVPSSL